MKGQCGASSLSSDTDLTRVTCEKCKRILEDDMTTKISFEDWMRNNGIVWGYLREKQKREMVLKWKSEQQLPTQEPQP